MSASMYTHNSENSTLSAPNNSSRCTSDTNINSGYDSSTKLSETVAGTNSSAQECELEQPNSDHPDMLHTTKTKHIQSAVTKFTRAHCRLSYLSVENISVVKAPLLCTCGEAFAHQRERKLHEELHRLHRMHSIEKKLVCRVELSVQLARTWGCDRQFVRADVFVRHFFSQGRFRRTYMIPLLDEEVEKTGVFRLPSVLLTQYPGLKHLDLALISAWQNAPTRGISSLSFDDSGDESSLHFDPPEPLFTSPKALRLWSSLSFIECQVMLSPTLQNLEELTHNNLTLSTDMPEASEDSEKSLVKTILSGDEPDCGGFSRGIGLSDHQIDLQRTSDSEARWSYKVCHVSKETTFAQERGCEKDGNSRLSDNAEGSLSPDESSSDSGSENGYNDTKEGSVLNCSQRALISRLMDEICSSFFYQVSHRPRQRGQGGQGSRESSSSSTEQTTTTNSFIGEYRGTWRKRGHKEDEDAEDEDDGKHKRPRDRNRNDSHSTRVRYFACPFHKFDASTYGSGNADPRVGLKYRSCGPPGWPNIGKLKEHLYRNHQAPIHCPRCWTIMKTEAALGEHARARNQCDILPPSLRWIPREVCEKLKNRKKAFAGQTEEDTWRYIFGLLFPDCPNVPSPYYDNDVTLEEMTQRNSPTSNAIAAYEEYARAHLPQLFEEALETAVAEHMQPIEEGLRRALPGMVRECQTRLAQNFLRHRTSNISSKDSAGVQAEALPSFYIEPLSLAEDIASIDPTQISINGHDRLQTHSDSGYASADTSLNLNSSGPSADLRSQNDIGWSHDSTCHGIDINGGSDLMSGFSDWVTLMDNNQDNNFFRDSLDNESI